MTLDGGRKTIDQKDVDMQIAAESSRSSGQGGLARPKERRCGTYGKTLNNARTCQVIIEMSGKEYSD